MPRLSRIASLLCGGRSLIRLAYQRLNSLVFFDRHVKLIGKASATIHPSTRLVMHNSRIVVENGCALIGYKYAGPSIKENCQFIMANSTLHIIGNVVLGPGCTIFAQDATIVIRNGTVITATVGLVAWRGIEIGEDCLVAEHVSILDNDGHKLSESGGKPVRQIKEVTIGNHCWIGMNTLILKGVTIGDGAIVAAGSIITSNVKEKTLVGGVPARVLREDMVWEA